MKIKPHHQDDDPKKTKDLNYEKVGYFKYLGRTLSNKNDWPKAKVFE